MFVLYARSIQSNRIIIHITYSRMQKNVSIIRRVCSEAHSFTLAATHNNECILHERTNHGHSSHHHHHHAMGLSVCTRRPRRRRRRIRC